MKERGDEGERKGSPWAVKIARERKKDGGSCGVKGGGRFLGYTSH